MTKRRQIAPNSHPPPPIDPLLTDEQVAAILNTSTRTVHRLVKSGQITAVHIGRSLRFRPRDVAAFIDRSANH